MKYKITHTTRYLYSEAVPVCRNHVHLTPRDGPRQSCREFRLLIDPAPSNAGRRVDYFGNHVNYFSILEAHQSLSVTARSKVEVGPARPLAAAETTPWENVVQRSRSDVTLTGLEAFQFTFDSPNVMRSESLAAFARDSFTPQRPVLEAALDLTSRIHEQFAYDAHATTIHTPLDEVMAQRRGVCQDFAHVQIGCLRSLGLPARYVSGYLRTEPPPGKPRLVGADASHAWISVYCGDLGWVDLDPTNDALVNSDHIQVALGRDYSDVCPIQGVYVGGGEQTVEVSVDVVPI
jgi:transglutaminase-like putative cysteine protease